MPGDEGDKTVNRSTELGFGRLVLGPLSLNVD